MIKMQNFNEGCLHYYQQKISLRLLQEQTSVLIGISGSQHAATGNSLEVTKADIDWLLH